MKEETVHAQDQRLCRDRHHSSTRRAKRNSYREESSISATATFAQLICCVKMHMALCWLDELTISASIAHIRMPSELTASFA